MYTSTDDGRKKEEQERPNNFIDFAAAAGARVDHAKANVGPCSFFGVWRPAQVEKHTCGAQ